MTSDSTTPNYAGAPECTGLNQHWLLKPRQRHIFAVSAILATVALLLGLVGNLIPDSEAAVIERSSAAPLLGVIIGLFLVPSAAWLWFGMGWYWFQLDKSSRRNKILWFLVLFVCNWVGAIAYYFVVYHRRLPAQSRSTQTFGLVAILLSCSFLGAIPFLYFYPKLATSKSVATMLLIIGLFIVFPTAIVVLVRLCRYGLRTAGK